jgi:hypothetical protein
MFPILSQCEYQLYYVHILRWSCVCCRSGNDPAESAPVDFDPDSCLASVTSMLQALRAEQLSGGSSASDSEGVLQWGV